jgi:hypothetical protein
MLGAYFYNNFHFAVKYGYSGRNSPEIFPCSKVPEYWNNGMMEWQTKLCA